MLILTSKRGILPEEHCCYMAGSSICYATFVLSRVPPFSFTILFPCIILHIICCSMEHFDQAAIFLESCLEHKVVQVTKETTPLTQSVYLEYARHLLSVGLVRGFKHYCSKAGSNGKQLLEDYFKQQISSQSPSKSPTPGNTSDSTPPLLVDLAP